MIRVSLLPPEIKKARQDQEKGRKLQLVILVILVTIAALNAFFLINNLLLKSNLNSLRQDRDFVERQAADLAEFDDLHTKITASEQLLNAAMGRTPLWSAFFRNISQSIPVTAWFSDLAANYSDQEGTLTIRGWSHDHSSLADLLERLEQIEQLDQVQCRVSTGILYRGNEAIQFQVDATLLPGPGLQPEEEGVE